MSDKNFIKIFKKIACAKMTEMLGVTLTFIAIGWEERKFVNQNHIIDEWYFGIMVYIHVISIETRYTIYDSLFLKSGFI